LARTLQMNLTWQLIAGGVTVLGHDFPVFANFKGGQGMATSLGTMSMLFLHETLIGFICFGIIYLITRHFDLSAACGLALLVYLLVKNLKSLCLLTYTFVLLLTIPIKKTWDANHRLSGSV
jgi:glycerol-3-phosphate acyltransferase PlsY